MNQKDFFKNIVEDEFTSSCIRDSNSQTAMCVMSMMETCDELLKVDTKKCDLDFRTRIVKELMRDCCQLMKSPKMSAMLVDAYYEGKIGTVTMELNEFLTNFYKRCNNNIGNRCRIILKNSPDTYVETNEKFFSVILLMHVRKALFKNSDKIEISFSSDKNYVAICLKAEEGKPDSDGCNMVCPDIYDNCIDELVSLFLSKIDAEISYSDNCTFIKCPESKSTTFSSSKSYVLSEDRMDIYGIMLAEFCKPVDFDKF